MPCCSDELILSASVAEGLLMPISSAQRTRPGNTPWTGLWSVTGFKHAPFTLTPWSNLKSLIDLNMHAFWILGRNWNTWRKPMYTQGEHANSTRIILYLVFYPLPLPGSFRSPCFFIQLVQKQPFQAQILKPQKEELVPHNGIF